jgi:hypothetical protein
MKIWTNLSAAFAGWLQILRRQPDWRGRFTLTVAGLAVALCIYAFTAFLAVALASTAIGMPGLLGVVGAMAVLGLPVLAFLVSLGMTRNFLKGEDPALPLLVPGVYVLTAFLLVEGVVAMVAGPGVMLAWVALGYCLFALARTASGWNVGIATAFAVLTVVLLVAMRLALYMLTIPAGSPL